MTTQRTPESGEPTSSAPELARHVHLPARLGWLAQYGESALEPDLPIIDPHQHIWDVAGNSYLFDDVCADMRSGHDVRATIFVECASWYRSAGPREMRPVGETEFIAAGARVCENGRGRPSSVCAGIVGFVDLLLGASSAPVLEAQVEASRGRLRGIRGRTAWHESAEVRTTNIRPGVLMEQSSRDAIALIQQRGLALDVWVYHTQLAEILDLARCFPQLTIVIDHCGGPVGIGPHRGRREEVFASWRRDIDALAALPNTIIKIGGLAMRCSGFDFHERPLPPSSDELARAWAPYVDTCISAFGPERCMLESNFPVDRAMCSYAVLWNAFKKLAASYSAAEKHSLFFGTAARIYDLDR